MITYNYGNSHSPITLLQMVGDHDLPGIENEIREIHSQSRKIRSTQNSSTSALYLI